MSKLLRSRLGVSLLAAAAVVVWAWGEPVIGVGRSTSATGTKRTAQPSAASTNPILGVLQHRSAIQQVLAEWQPPTPTPATDRDPFLFAAPSVSALNGDPNQAKRPDLVLQAVSIADGKALAVVSRRVVAAGESVGDWRVTRIEPDEVWVQGATGTYVLRFRREPVRRIDDALAAHTAAPSSPTLETAIAGAP